MPAMAARTITSVVLEQRFSAEGNGTSVAIDGSQAGDTLTVNAVARTISTPQADYKSVPATAVRQPRR
jgi:hypothetical protein